MFTGWWFQRFLEFSPRSLGKMNPFWLAHIFQMGGQKPPTSYHGTSCFAWQSGIKKTCPASTNMVRFFVVHARGFRWMSFKKNGGLAGHLFEWCKLTLWGTLKSQSLKWIFPYFFLAILKQRAVSLQVEWKVWSGHLVLVNLGSLQLQNVSHSEVCPFEIGHLWVCGMILSNWLATSHDRFPPNGGLVREMPLFQLISGKPRLVKYCNLARWLG